MKIAVIGAGLMGPTIALDCLESTGVEEVQLIDVSEERLKKAAIDLGNPSKLKLQSQDVLDRVSFASAMKDIDVVCIALPRSLSPRVIRNAIAAQVNAVDLSDLPKQDWEDIDESAKKADVTIIPGCGLEPGLTEILAAHGMDKLDSVEAVNIWCGGLPQDPKPPLGYKIVYGGRHLPLYPGNVKIIEDGECREVKRYTDGGRVRFKGIPHELESYYERFPETLTRVEKFQGVKMCSAKTVRYAGYTAKVRFLEECGLLSREPISQEGHSITPFEFFSKIIYPKVRMVEGEKDVTVLKVVVEGFKKGLRTSYAFTLVDFYDENRDITSMARTTSFPAAIVARMLGRKSISRKGLTFPAEVLREELLRDFLKELSVRSVNISERCG
ncbi:MAG: saccharopine dehydrogenase NADP-binding domain-containing protein [Candidatus Bathyarchaeota archaeon]|nr:MAG: saccharopine dehydrogenase NADP-binding domain-containing protein [Candidatus Bathyarchaeota archaeon]